MAQPRVFAKSDRRAVHEDKVCGILVEIAGWNSRTVDVGSLKLGEQIVELECAEHHVLEEPGVQTAANRHCEGILVMRYTSNRRRPSRRHSVRHLGDCDAICLNAHCGLEVRKVAARMTATIGVPDCVR
jgi:hypothetical protein